MTSADKKLEETIKALQEEVRKLREENETLFKRILKIESEIVRR